MLQGGGGAAKARKCPYEQTLEVLPITDLLLPRQTPPPDLQCDYGPRKQSHNRSYVLDRAPHSNECRTPSQAPLFVLQRLVADTVAHTFFSRPHGLVLRKGAQRFRVVPLTGPTRPISCRERWPPKLKVCHPIPKQMSHRFAPPRPEVPFRRRAMHTHCILLQPQLQFCQALERSTRLSETHHCFACDAVLTECQEQVLQPRAQP